MGPYTRLGRQHSLRFSGVHPQVRFLFRTEARGATSRSSDEDPNLDLSGHSKVILWDNNILGNDNWEPIFDELAGMSLEVDFNQGLDARRVTPLVAEKLAKLKLHSIRMVYDYPGVGPFVKQAIETLAAADISPERSSSTPFTIMLTALRTSRTE